MNLMLRKPATLERGDIMRKKYIDYYAIQCDILKKLDDSNNRCMIINYGTEKVLTDGVYGVRMAARDIHLKIDDPVKTLKNIDFVFDYAKKYDYVQVSSIVPVSYKKKQLYKLSSGVWSCYVNRKYFDFFGCQVGVYITSSNNMPVLFMDRHMVKKGFLFPVIVCEEEIV